MQHAAHIYLPHHSEHREHRVSLSKLTVIFGSLALWATMIGGVVMILR